MGKASVIASDATDGKHGCSCSGDCATTQSHSTRSAYRPTDSAGARYAGPSFGPAEKGDHTIWLVGFGNTWIPVAVTKAESWHDARQKGERLFPWVERGHVEASPGNQLSTFVGNAATSAAQYAAKQRLRHFMSRNAQIPPQARTQIPSAGSG
jgi:hypothetical protein